MVVLAAPLLLAAVAATVFFRIALGRIGYETKKIANFLYDTGYDLKSPYGLRVRTPRQIQVSG